MLNWGVFGAELRDVLDWGDLVWNWGVFGVELRDFGVELRDFGCWKGLVLVWNPCVNLRGSVWNWGVLLFLCFSSEKLISLENFAGGISWVTYIKKTLLKILACGNNLHEKACKSVRKSEPAWQPDGGRWPQDANFRERKNELNLSHQNFTWDLMLYIKYILSCKK